MSTNQQKAPVQHISKKEAYVNLGWALFMMFVSITWLFSGIALLIGTDIAIPHIGPMWLIAISCFTVSLIMTVGALRCIVETLIACAKVAIKEIEIDRQRNT